MRKIFCVSPLLSLIGGLACAETPVDTMTAADIEAGQRTFAVHCARCHGMRGGGGEGANLAKPRLKYANDEQALYDLIENGIPGTAMPDVWAISEEQRWQVVAYVRSLGEQERGEMPGDPERGREIYEERAGCPACHIVAGRGRGIGPELTEVGDRRGQDYLHESLLEPSAAQPTTSGYADFLTVRARYGGRVIEGMRVNEDAFSIQVRDVSGALHSFRKDELAGLDKIPSHSLMPPLGDALSSAEIDDLVSYLMSLRSEP